MKMITFDRIKNIMLANIQTISHRLGANGGQGWFCDVMMHGCFGWLEAIDSMMYESGSIS